MLAGCAHDSRAPNNGRAPATSRNITRLDESKPAALPATASAAPIIEVPLGALSGSLSVAKFWVRGELPRDPRRSFMERIKLRRFRPLSADDEVEERYGWCTVGSPTDFELSTGKVFHNEYLALGFRWDRFRFPAALVNAQLAEAMQQARQRSGEDGLSRSAKANLKQAVLAKLKRKYFPSMRMVDLVWNLDRQVVHFWSHSAALHERMCASFEVTFGLELDLNSPYVAAQKLLPGRTTQQTLQNLQCEPFHGPR
jgi:hypothetical protein